MVKATQSVDGGRAVPSARKASPGRLQVVGRGGARDGGREDVQAVPARRPRARRRGAPRRGLRLLFWAGVVGLLALLAPAPPEGGLAQLAADIDALAGYGGSALLVIAGFAVLAALIVAGKMVQLLYFRAWSRRRVDQAVTAWLRGERRSAERLVAGSPGLRATVVRGVFEALLDPQLASDQVALEARRLRDRAVARTEQGFSWLSLVAELSPMVGLLGTVIGMITAFRALDLDSGTLEVAGLATGIWQGLITTAAGMVVAIPTLAALVALEGLSARLRLDLDDIIDRLAPRPPAKRRTAFRF